ncbi:AraC family transcriptional regulator [Bacteroides helcogenes]|uniref:Transcriptional regulator, AraC family n=1 Tax=Bacteroides helcogenes (strain ATCC 35417 / DSM 20613 / JCM 6297 / CCUG 15421 / P 36-108) TaxID=693979 RepID=E6SSD1_BACT6|nr:helix-turn-helix domain-containing protein [Bacteroides helcogenes]ADV45182.1 transcriptional regulator, AraC family [Bacteroides helcogenes P 36-108]MDY5238743.1 helix-turn-helix domain-containing protein [Bacteroides helcogenes]
MEKDIPKIDMPEDWVAGTDIKKELLSLYKDYPVRLKCEVLILCMGGEIEASVNLNRIVVHPQDIVLLTPGNILQIHRIDGELKVYFLGFAERFLGSPEQAKHLLEAVYLAFGQPVISLKLQGASLMEDYFSFLIKVFNTFNEDLRKELTPNLYATIHTGVRLLYKDKNAEKMPVSKNEQLCRKFAQLVVQHYSRSRNVGWYAVQLGITHAYLCSVVKQITGKTCMEIIASMVIMDAKSQLKLTGVSVQAISDSLNFADISFFGKYFKRYVGMSPLEYRNGRS